MNYYFSALKKYAQFAGRSRRKELWVFSIMNFVIVFALAFLDSVLGTFDAESEIGLLSGLYVLAALVPSIALMVRCVHDLGYHGAFVLITIIPLIGWFCWLFFALKDSVPGDNQYGPNPKEMEA